MNKHTLGPWRDEWDCTGWAILNGEATCVAECPGKTANDPSLNDQVEEANARLIASAPELLFALRYIMEQQHIGHIHDTASAAIAKAEDE